MVLIFHFVINFNYLLPFSGSQCSSLDKLDKKPCKILWDVPWENLLAIELAKAGYDKPSHLIIHLQNFRRSESFARIIRCDVGNSEDQEPQAIIICSTIQRMWKTHQANKKIVVLKVSMMSWNECP